MTDYAPAPKVPSADAGPKKIKSASDSAKSFFTRVLVSSDLFGISVPIVLLAVMMSMQYPGFASAFNVEALLATIAVTSMVGLAQVSVLSVGQFNLALPAMGAFTGMVLGWLLQAVGLGWVLSVILALAFSMFLGFVQGVVISRLRINAFVVTLGLASAYMGLMFVVLGNERFQNIGTALPNFGRGSIGNVPYIFIASISICFILSVVVRYTVMGRHLLATGANPLAARFTAIPVEKVVIGAHVASGALAGIAAILVVSRLAVGSPAIGQDWLLTSFAAPVLGGTLLGGGKVSVFGCVLGAILLTMISNSLVIVGVSQYWYQTGLGLIILAAVSFDKFRLDLLLSGRVK